MRDKRWKENKGDNSKGELLGRGTRGAKGGRRVRAILLRTRSNGAHLFLGLAQIPQQQMPLDVAHEIEERQFAARRPGVARRLLSLALLTSTALAPPQERREFSAAPGSPPRARLLRGGARDRLRLPAAICHDSARCAVAPERALDARSVLYSTLAAGARARDSRNYLESPATNRRKIPSARYRWKTREDIALVTKLSSYSPFSSPVAGWGHRSLFGPPRRRLGRRSPNRSRHR